MQRRILAYAAALALLVSLTACGKRETAAPTEAQTAETQTTAAREAEGDIAAPQENEAQTTKQTQASEDAAASSAITPSEALAMNSNTGPLFQKYVREKVADGTYTLRTEQSGMKIVVSTDGDDSAMESDAAGLLRFSLVHKDGSYYMIMHTTKKYAQMTEEEYKKQVNSVGSSGIDLDGIRLLSSGSETVNGKQYGTETYDEGEQGIVTYFFDATGVRRTRVVKDGKTNELDVFTVSDDADASAFDIPAGYTLVSDPAQLMT